MNVLPRLIRRRVAWANLGMDLNRFGAEVRPLTEISIGEQKTLRQHRMARVLKLLAAIELLSGEHG